MTAVGQRQVVLLLGPPGAGKGTQARFLSEVLGVPHIASGDLLRRHRERGTPLGVEAQAYMDRGDLVPDQLVVDMVVDRLERPDARTGALLDGFPRTRAQAQVLDSNLAERASRVRAALYIAVPKDILVERLAGRWLCRSCQATYPGLATEPPHGGRCVGCGDTLYQRPDDRADVVQNRIEVYLRETMPVVDHYAQDDLLVGIDGNRSIEAVRGMLCMSLGGLVRGRRHDRWHIYIENQAHVGENNAAWHGRTLCGKFVDASTDHELGSEDNFYEHACRRCRLELRTRQGPMGMGPSSAAHQRAFTR